MRSVIWNPWHGCEKYSEGCMNCYVYRRDGSVGRDASQVLRTNAFYLPRQKTRDGSYKVPSGSLVYCCMTSDLFLHLADAWRPEIWDMIRERGDLYFVIITKRIERAYKCLPTDWGDGWDNVELMCTAENQRVCDIRLPIFAAFPAKSRSVICEPLLGPIDMSRYLGR
ncbi:MAG: DUF5131 family protein, partial [Oscillospiraceae bacterium]|nr:DUF5131 family protein [Oscillospiraceae bacterium]